MSRLMLGTSARKIRGKLIRKQRGMTSSARNVAAAIHP
jgi:hypothetical protein